MAMVVSCTGCSCDVSPSRLRVDVVPVNGQGFSLRIDCGCDKITLNDLRLDDVFELAAQIDQAARERREQLTAKESQE